VLFRAPPCRSLDGNEHSSISDARSGRLVDVLLLLVYSPVLICLPILLLGGVIMVLVRSGFIIILAGAFFTLGSVWNLLPNRRRPVPRDVFPRFSGRAICA